jgi:hypothetical protein
MISDDWYAFALSPHQRAFIAAARPVLTAWPVAFRGAAIEAKFPDLLI